MDNTKNMNNQENTTSDVSGAIGVAILGGVLLLAGLVTFIARSWEFMDPILRIGLAFAAVGVAHVAGYALTKARNYAYTGSIFHTVGMFLLPTAFAVFFYETQSTLSSALEVFIAATASALAYLPFAYATRRSIFTVFGVLNMLIATGSLAYVAFGQSTGEGLNYREAILDGETMNYIYLLLIMACGFIGYSLRTIVYPAGHQTLLVLGVIGTAGFGFFMGEFYGNGGMFQVWDLWYPILTGAMVYVGSEFKNEVIRWSGIIGLVSASLVLFSKYADDVGLSVIIAVVGALLIGLAYRMVKKEREGK
jgi:Predicted membrane protein (DUF2157)